MSRKRSQAIVNRAALRELEADIAGFQAGMGDLSRRDEEVLSLLVSSALRGEDISEQYPDLYRRLIQEAGLRQAFLDALESVEDERAHRLIHLPGAEKSRLDFLRERPGGAAVERMEHDGWRASWERTILQIQAVFSPPEVAYRSDPALPEEPWFTLVRDEIAVDGILCSVSLECAAAEDRENMLQIILNVAVTLPAGGDVKPFPLQASLRWATYNETIQLMEEGPARFPNISLNVILDASHQRIADGLTLNLRTAS